MATQLPAAKPLLYKLASGLIKRLIDKAGLF